MINNGDQTSPARPGWARFGSARVQHSPEGRQKRSGVLLGVKDGRTECWELGAKTTQEQRVLKSTNPPPPLPPPALRSASLHSVSTRRALQRPVRSVLTPRSTGGAALQLVLNFTDLAWTDCETVGPWAKTLHKMIKTSHISLLVFIGKQFPIAEDTFLLKITKPAETANVELQPDIHLNAGNTTLTELE